MQLALKIDVDTLRGTREGVPALLRAAQGRTVPMPPFCSAWAPITPDARMRRAFSGPGFFGKVARTSVLEHYGLKTLLYGTLLPGPDIGRRAAAVMRSVRDAGFEVGDALLRSHHWQDFVSRRDAAWTRTQMLRAVERFREVFGDCAQVHGAAGWQMNDGGAGAGGRTRLPTMPRTRAAVRRSCRCWPVARSRCPQLPTTLPTLDELIGVDGIDAEQRARGAARARTRQACAHQVFTLHAELEGMKLRPVLRAAAAGLAGAGL